jgi:hypothetical protein
MPRQAEIDLRGRVDVDDDLVHRSAATTIHTREDLAQWDPVRVPARAFDQRSFLQHGLVPRRTTTSGDTSDPVVVPQQVEDRPEIEAAGRLSHRSLVGVLELGALLIDQRVPDRCR